MTSKTSLFNKGIYKSTVKRYKWGSFLYFIILFLLNGMSILLSGKERYAHLTDAQIAERFMQNPLILRGDHLGVSAIISLFVPTVTALLILRFVHSKKSAVFNHSIPTSRKSNYFSSLLGAFTLMVIPVIINGMILAIISLSGYGDYFTINSCLIWTGILLYILFTMFACAVFASMITGNSFAAVVLNVLVHCFVISVAAGLSAFASKFLYGYTSNNAIMDTLAENNFFVIGASLGNSQSFRENFSPITAMVHICVSIVIYFVSYFMYKKRKLENAEEIAGFECLNSIFKYSVTFLATVAAFGILSYTLEDAPVYFVSTVTAVSIITYFASEMLLKKSFNVFKRSYKGYIGFAIAFLCMTAIFSHTTFFGYETYVPKTEDIESASVFSYYYSDNEPFTTDSELIKYVTDSHSEFVKDDNIPITVSGYYETRLHFKYKLKNGREVHRIYRVNTEKQNRIMDVMYENSDYKMKSEPVFKHGESAYAIELYVNYQQYSRNAKIKPEEVDEFIRVIQDEVLSLSFSELHNGGNSVMNGYIDFTTTNSGQNHEATAEYHDEDGKYYKREHFTMNANYKNTIKWLTQKGYIEPDVPLEKITER